MGVGKGGGGWGGRGRWLGGGGRLGDVLGVSFELAFGMWDERR